MTSLRSCICSGNKILSRIVSKLLGFWLRSSFVLLNPCETVRIQRKTMFMRVKMGTEEEIKYIVVCMRVLYDGELRRATRERMFTLQGPRRQHYISSIKMVECAVVGCSNRTPRDSKRGISFHRLPPKYKPLFKEWLVLKLSQCQICSEHFEKFRALDTNPRKWSLGLPFVNKSFEREGAVLFI